MSVLGIENEVLMQAFLPTEPCSQSQAPLNPPNPPSGNSSYNLVNFFFFNLRLFDLQAVQIVLEMLQLPPGAPQTNKLKLVRVV